jgi:uracil-DNA glycosylase
LKESHNYDTPWKTLAHWEKQGVFLLNTALTVESTKPGSHIKVLGDLLVK